MSSKYIQMLNEAKKEKICFFYQKLLKQIIADKALEDQTFISQVFKESIGSILTNDQKKTMKGFAKELLTDKSLLKEINDLIKNA